MNIGEALLAAQAQLAPVSDSPRLDAEILLGHMLGGLSRAQLFVRLHDVLDAAARGEFEALVKRRMRAEPVAYITGEKGFWTLTLKVTPAVLVPRPETELLVEWALDIVDSSFPKKRESRVRLADLGTGSGCIALALATELPNAEVLAVDISGAALGLAAENARTLGIGNVKFLEAGFSEAFFKVSESAVPSLLPTGEGGPKGRMRDYGSSKGSHFQAVLPHLGNRSMRCPTSGIHALACPSPGGRGENDGLFDLIVSNPPYIARDDRHLDALRHEPLMALTDGGDGLNALREIIAAAPARLTAGGALLLEHGYEQGAAVRELLRQAGFSQIETRRDLAGHERASGGIHR